MKKIIVAIIFLLPGHLLNAQTKKSNNSGTPAATSSQDAVKTVTVSPNTFESSLVSGKLTLLKIFRKDGNGAPLPVTYQLVSYSDPALLNNGKPVEINSLGSGSFESVFTSSSSLTAKLPALHKFIQDNKIVLSEEKGWVLVLKHFNVMP